MSTTPSDPIATEHRHRHRRHRAPRGPVLQFLREWWVELLVVLAVLLAVFLLLEQFSIRQTLAGGLRDLVDGARGLLSGLGAGLLAWVKSTTLSDLLAYGLLFGVVAVLLGRQRQRLMSSPRTSTLSCPECGSGLHRIHRHWPDRLLSLYVPVRRYECENHDCLWRGLRVRRSRHE